MMSMSSKKEQSAFEWWLKERPSNQKSSLATTGMQTQKDIIEWDTLPDKSRWYQIAALDKQRCDTEMCMQRLLARPFDYGGQEDAIASESPPKRARMDSTPSNDFQREPQHHQSAVAESKTKVLSPCYVAAMHFFYDIFRLLKRVEIEQCRRVCRFFDEKVVAWPKLAVPLPNYTQLFSNLAFSIEQEETDEDEYVEDPEWDINEDGWAEGGEGQNDWRSVQPLCCRGGELELLKRLSKRLVDQLIFPTSCNQKAKLALFHLPMKKGAQLHFTVANLMTEETAFAYLHLLSHLSDVVFVSIYFLNNIRLHAEPFRLLSTMARGANSPTMQFRLLCEYLHCDRVWAVGNKWLAHHKPLIQWCFLDGEIRGFRDEDRKEKLEKLLAKIHNWRPYTDKLAFFLRSTVLECIEQIVKHFLCGTAKLHSAVPYISIDIGVDIQAWPAACPKSKGKMTGVEERNEKWVFSLANEHSKEKFCLTFLHPVGRELHIEKMIVEIQTKEEE